MPALYQLPPLPYRADEEIEKLITEGKYPLEQNNEAQYYNDIDELSLFIYKAKTRELAEKAFNVLKHNVENSETFLVDIDWDTFDDFLDVSVSYDVLDAFPVFMQEHFKKDDSLFRDLSAIIAIQINEDYA